MRNLSRHLLHMQEKLAIAAFIFLFFSCTSSTVTGDNANKPVVATAITLDKSSCSIDVGGQLTLAASILPAEAVIKDVTWISSNPEYVTVNNSGVISGVSIGTATITASLASGELSAQCTVEVQADTITVASVVFSQESWRIIRGTTQQLALRVMPDNATNKAVTFASSDVAIATVTEAGMVNAIEDGTVTVTVTTVDGHLTDSCTVQVVQPGSVTSVSFAKKTLALDHISAHQMIATVLPENATNKTVTYSSSDTSVVTIDSTGYIMTQGYGKAVVTVTTENGNLTDTCVVSVLTKEEVEAML